MPAQVRHPFRRVFAIGVRHLINLQDPAAEPGDRGGLLTGFYLENPELLSKNIRFDPKSLSGSFYGPRYAHSKPVLERVKALAVRLVSQVCVCSCV
jgi:hypothetical protein